MLNENFKPQTKLEEEVNSWKEKLMTNLSSMEKLKENNQHGCMRAFVWGGGAQRKFWVPPWQH